MKSPIAILLIQFFFAITFITAQDTTSYPEKSYLRKDKNWRIDVYNLFVKNEDYPLINLFSQLSLDNMFYLYYIKPGVAYELFYEMIGREKFIAAMKEYVKRWKGKHPTPWDYFYTMNDALGENYNWFWKAWFFDLGYPDMAVELRGYSVIVKRVGEGSLPLPVVLTVNYKDGTTKIIEKPMSVWKNGDMEIEIQVENIRAVKSISLDVSKVPDINPLNNILEIN